VVFDRAGMLERLMDDEELAGTVVRGFLADVPRQIEALGAYLQSGEAAGAERQAHTIRGAAANVGGEALRGVAFEIEKAGKAGDLRAANALRADLAAAFDRLREEMEKRP
jgi:HPt (histidine-containing phosphotransfer) domain-containing protein